MLMGHSRCQRHGLSKTRYRSLEKVAFQGLMTASVQNIKRLLALYLREQKGYIRIKGIISNLMAFWRPQVNLILEATCEATASFFTVH